MSTVDSVVDAAAVNTADDIEDSVDIPDDFFDEFEDSKFLDEIVEIVVPEQTRLVRTEENSTETINDDEDPTEPMLKRCIDDIENLSKSIKRRKQKIQSNLDAHKRKRSFSPSTSRYDRNFRSRDRSRLSPRRSRSRSRSGRRVRSRSRDRNRSRDRRPTRRDRSRSGSPVPHSRTTFLEELERKFAEKGQDFPEKDLLMKLRATTNGTISHSPTIAYQQEVPMCMPPYIQLPTIQMSMYNQPYPPYWNGNYMMDPMVANMQHPMQPIPMMPPLPNDAIVSNVIPNATKTSE